MKTVASLAFILCLGLAACAEGSVVPSGDLDGDASPGAGTTGDAATIVIIGEADGAVGTTPPGATGTGTPTGTTNTAGDDAGFGGGSGFGDDSGDGFGDDSGDGLGDGTGFGDDSGFGFGDDSGDGFGDDSGFGFGDDSGGDGTCEGYAYPDTYADCTCTASDPSECQANGCYNGYYCDTNTDKCKSTAPSGC